MRIIKLSNINLPMSQKIKLLTDRNASNSQINIYAPESKINVKLHQTYINNRRYNNTHKMQCMIQNNKKMTGNGSHRMIIIRHISDQVTANRISTR